VRGISGDRVRDVAARLAPSALEAPCRDVALLAGSNDVVGDGAPPDEIAAQVAELAERLRTAGKRVVVTTLPPVRDRYAPASASIRAVNETLRALAARGFLVLDLHAALAGDDGLLDPRYSLDGLHLSAAGYERWADLLAAALAAPDEAR
jgi:lysophospholipase L1-like esterase